MNQPDQFEQSEEINPYRPPPDAEAEQKFASPFKLEYWASLTGLLFLTMPLIYFVPPLGIVLFLTVVFAFVRSFMQLNRIRRDRIESAANSIGVWTTPFLLSSLGVGFLTTFASGIAFVAVCFPTGLAFFGLGNQVSNSAEYGVIGVVLIFGISLVIAIWIAILILRRSIR